MRFQKHGRFFKTANGVAYGFAFVSTVDGEAYYDLGDGEYSDHIPVDSIEPVSKHFMDSGRVGLDMHTGEQVADVLYAMPIRDDIVNSNGMTSRKQGLLIGWRGPAEILAKIDAGERTGFSIGGLVSAWDIVDADGNVIESVALTDKSATAFGAGLKIGALDAAKFCSTHKLDANQTVIVKAMRRRIFRAWKLAEISLVDYPMQEPALVGVVSKRREINKAMRKIATIAMAIDKAAVVFTSIVDGHQHVIDTSTLTGNGTGSTSWETAQSAAYGHSHTWLRDGTGAIVMTMTEGHTHDIVTELPTTGARIPPHGSETIVASQAAKNLTAGTGTHTVHRMPDLDLQVTALTSQVDALTKSLSVATRIATLSDVHKAHYGRLDADDQPAFLAKSTADREIMIKAAADADPVAYTTKSGKVYRESQRELADMAKMVDEQAEETAKARAERDDQIYAKQALGIRKFPGTPALKSRMIKALREGLKTDKGAIDDDAFRSAMEMLRGAADALDAGFAAVGSDAAAADVTMSAGDGDGAGSPQGNAAKAELDTLVDKFAADNSIAHKSVARNKLLEKSAPARKLYEIAKAYDAKHRARA